MFEEIYHEYLVYKNELNRKERYKGNEGWYHASGAGFCSRKLYFESVEKAEPTNLPNKRSTRIMGLGTAIHNELQSSLLYYNNNNNKDNINKDNNNTDIDNKEYIVDCLLHNFHTEGEIVLKDLNVRGFYDVVMEDYTKSKNDPYIRLYDIKSISNFGYRKKFPRNGHTEINRNHNLQLSTYGLAVKEKFGHLDSMDLVYYNKDDSRIKLQSVPVGNTELARRYWASIKQEHSKGLPVFNLGTSPTSDWMCGYCQFLDHCKPPNFKNK